jgi:hypothetical protein
MLSPLASRYSSGTVFTVGSFTVGPRGARATGQVYEPTVREIDAAADSNSAATVFRSWPL